MPRPPATLVGTPVGPDIEVSRDKMLELIDRTWAEHGDVLTEYGNVWFQSGHTWCFNSFMGVAVLKNPNDLWTYQQIVAAFKPQTIIETGTHKGGSALWFAYLQEMACAADARVVTIDITSHRRECVHPRVTYLVGSSVDPVIVAQVTEALIPGAPILISLDSEHTANHVYDELCAYAPLVPIGSWLVVEDTNVSWPGYDGGAAAGLRAYLDEHPGEWQQDRIAEKFLLTMNPGGWLFRVGACPHG